MLCSSPSQFWLQWQGDYKWPCPCWPLWQWIQVWFHALRKGHHCVFQEWRVHVCRPPVPDVSSGDTCRECHCTHCLFQTHWAVKYPYLLNKQRQEYIYIYAFSRRFYPKRLAGHSGYTCFVSMCSLGIEPTQPFVLLTQCSTTEPQKQSRPKWMDSIGYNRIFGMI